MNDRASAILMLLGMALFVIGLLHAVSADKGPFCVRLAWIGTVVIIASTATVGVLLWKLLGVK